MRMLAEQADDARRGQTSETKPAAGAAARRPAKAQGQGQGPSPDQVLAAAPRPATRRRERPKIGRNDPCWCGSGKKFKKCHLGEDEA